MTYKHLIFSASFAILCLTLPVAASGEEKSKLFNGSQNPNAARPIFVNPTVANPGTNANNTVSQAPSKVFLQTNSTQSYKDIVSSVQAYNAMKEREMLDNLHANSARATAESYADSARRMEQIAAENRQKMMASNTETGQAAQKTVKGGFAPLITVPTAAPQKKTDPSKPVRLFNVQ